ncbi:polymer-forming cytoskeletal protein [Dehalobacter sp. TeCB1]|uniref:bactofilin family protein n=1 Tax=Dehalobacter sp. TeCB1 TaxID=1843715 RepID=UPI00083B85B8|nr:polymer-forming cytoskeletal protein [Dehalobacter sp. TeCB1]OCZ52723.1 cell shape determination protein CcmA [Dehalobacter sp. TeCB1]
MFSKKENDTKPVIRNISTNTNITYIAEDCELKGSLVSSGNIRIDGKLEGTVEVGGDLIIGQSASVKANISSATATITGVVCGNIKVEDLLELSPTSRLYGDITAKQLKIDQGAIFVGTSSIVSDSIDHRDDASPEKKS